ncbi:three-helix bundle dimerization domain-containing protein [Rhodococcus sp. NPDC003348]
MLPSEERHLIALATRRLADKHSDLPIETVAAAVARARDHFADRPIRDFVPLLVERHAERELAAATRLDA